jgi:hypothetical protein
MNRREIIAGLGSAAAWPMMASYPTPSNQCWPEGVPYIFEINAIQLVQQAHTITILYDNDHQVRHVRLNELHPARVTPSWYGDSIGHYEGDTLVIDTVGIKIGPFSMIDRFGTPFSHAFTRSNVIGLSTMRPRKKRKNVEQHRFSAPASVLQRPRALRPIQPNHLCKGQSRQDQHGVWRQRSSISHLRRAVQDDDRRRHGSRALSRRSTRAD